jgi:neurotransmitter:Na+ symporter, NSS family
MAAAAVGLGNLWRFPYMVGENGGAAFILAYLIALIVIVLPIMMLEVSAGRLAQGGAVHTFAQVNRFGKFFGWCVVALTAGITSYYLVITGWTLGYAVDAWRGDVRDFDVFTGGYNSLWYFFAVAVLVVALLIKGVKAIEQFSNFLMPLLLVTIVALVVVASRMPGWGEAKEFLLEADFSQLTDTRLWMFAIGQAFYSVAVGQGYITTYGSYIPRETHVPRACLIVGGTEACIAIMAGWMIFPFVFSYDLDPGEGSQLAFSTLPAVFQDMSWGMPLAIIFFSLFFVAAFSSCIAGMKVVIAAVAEEFGLQERTALFGVFGLMIVLGTPSALSFTPVELTVAGMPFLDFMDQFGGTNVVIASGVIGAALFCWFVPRERVRDALGVRTTWWEWRIYIVGRALPFIVVAWLLWTLV